MHGALANPASLPMTQSNPPIQPRPTPMPQLILLPGLASDDAMWRAQLDALPASLNSTVTDVHARHGSIEAMAAGLLNDHAGELILCGASMGGMLAMEAVRQAPHRVRGLALLGTSARPESEDMRALRSGAIELFRQGRVEEILLANVPLAFAPHHATNPALVQTYQDMVQRAGADQLIRQNLAVMARPDARAHLGAVSCPTLVMCGEDDQLTPPECSREIAYLAPRAELVLVAQCGHMLTLEQPASVNDTLLGWLARLG